MVAPNMCYVNNTDRYDSFNMDGTFIFCKFSFTIDNE